MLLMLLNKQHRIHVVCTHARRYDSRYATVGSEENWRLNSLCVPSLRCRPLNATDRAKLQTPAAVAEPIVSLKGVRKRFAHNVEQIFFIQTYPPPHPPMMMLWVIRGIKAIKIYCAYLYAFAFHRRQHPK